MNGMKRFGMFLLAGAIAAMAAGCAPGEPDPADMQGDLYTFPPEMLKDMWSAQEAPQAHLIRRDYRIREGDQLEVIYHVRHKPVNIEYEI